MRSGWLAALSVVVSAGAIAAYALLLRVPAVRNSPEGYVAAFAIAATLAGLAVALGRRWYAWTALVLSLVLLLGGATFNFVLARIPAAPSHLHVGARAPDFTLPDAGGRPVSLADYRGKKPVVLVFYRGYW
jgi:cytochrome oxidase Cu insertion factor (SCO1/SenC/PrrC family)